MPKTPPLERAADGVQRVGIAAEKAVDLARSVLPQFYDLAERFVVAHEKIAVVSVYAAEVSTGQ